MVRIKRWFNSAKGHQKEIMKNKIKPIPSTPDLDRHDFDEAVKDALKVPSEASIDRNERRLKDFEKVYKN